MPIKILTTTLNNSVSPAEPSSLSCQAYVNGVDWVWKCVSPDALWKNMEACRFMETRGIIKVGVICDGSCYFGLIVVVRVVWI